MKIVLYTYDFEPITVIDVALDSITKMVDNRCHCFRVAVPAKLDLVSFTKDQPVMIDCRTVTINIHQLNFLGKKKYLFLVDERDLMNAFDLRSTTLPGQRDSLERAFQEGVNKGISSLLTLMGNLNDD